MPIVHSIKDYKMALIFVKDLNNLIEQTEKTIAYYKQYRKYRPVQRILYTLEEECDILRAHLTKCTKIIETRGQVLR